MLYASTPASTVALATVPSFVAKYLKNNLQQILITGFVFRPSVFCPAPVQAS